mmetsp:Transcript_34490/g.45593  ORF Transcript_34490/g.45593 Transcript_34490/m.45593 type:complete len:86 (+) Transcript_34490:192-449(+)
MYSSLLLIQCTEKVTSKEDDFKVESQIRFCGCPQQIMLTDFVMFFRHDSSCHAEASSCRIQAKFSEGPEQKTGVFYSNLPLHCIP